MGPKVEEAVPETEIPEITAEEFPEWHALATEAMAEVERGEAERWT